MKYAIKTQQYNPNRPAGMNQEFIWIKKEIGDDFVAAHEADGWIVSNTDDYMEKLLSTPKVHVPETITPRQARQALLMAGISEAMIVGAINTLPSPVKDMALIEWEYSTAFIRSNPLVTTMASMLGWTSKQLDDLWVLGSTL